MTTTLTFTADRATAASMLVHATPLFGHVEVGHGAEHWKPYTRLRLLCEPFDLTPAQEAVWCVLCSLAGVDTVSNLAELGRVLDVDTLAVVIAALRVAWGVERQVAA